MWNKFVKILWFFGKNLSSDLSCEIKNVQKQAFLKIFGTKTNGEKYKTYESENFCTWRNEIQKCSDHFNFHLEFCSKRNYLMYQRTTLLNFAEKQNKWRLRCRKDRENFSFWFYWLKLNNCFSIPMAKSLTIPWDGIKSHR